MFAGSIFFGAPLFVIPNVVLLALLIFVVRVRVSVLSVAALLLMNAALGLAVGSTFFRGQLP